MADMLSDPTLHTEHAAIRHDIGEADANIRSKIGEAEGRVQQSVADGRRESERGFADTRYNIATEAARTNTHIGDVRQEQAENFGHTRRDIQSTAADIARQVGDGFCTTDSKVLERAGDIRREVAGGFDKTGDMIMQEGQEGIMATKDARYDLSSRITNGTDRTSDRIMELRGLVGERFYTVGRDLSDLRQGQATLSKDIELNALKTQLDAKQNTQYLADKVVQDGEKTRGLINDLKYHDLSRGLVERNTELVNCEQDRRHYHDRYHDGRFDMLQAGFQGQWAQLQTQIQAFQSQLQETRQGMVNFGTMAGNAGQQSSTSNNVR